MPNVPTTVIWVGANTPWPPQFFFGGHGYHPPPLSYATGFNLTKFPFRCSVWKVARYEGRAQRLLTKVSRWYACVSSLTSPSTCTFGLRHVSSSATHVFSYVFSFAHCWLYAWVAMEAIVSFSSRRDGYNRQGFFTYCALHPNITWIQDTSLGQILWDTIWRETKQDGSLLFFNDRCQFVSSTVMGSCIWCESSRHWDYL